MPADYDARLTALNQRRDPDGIGSVGIGLLEYGVLPDVDPSSMSARFRICTPREDREGDIIEPSGVDWSDYFFAPAVKYEHGFTGIPLPIARSSDASGNLHVFYGHEQPDGEVEDALYARAFFSESHELSAQMFGLIEEGFLRAASIHVLPIEGCYSIRPDDSCHARQSSLLEWSVCSVGMNPDAYAKSLQKDSSLSELLHLQLESAGRILKNGTLGTRKLLPSIAKCLTAVQPPKQPLVRGHFTEYDEDEMTTKKTLTQAQVDNLSLAALAKALVEPAAFDADSLKLLRAKAKSYTEDDMEKTGSETDQSLAKMGGEEDELAKMLETDQELVKADDDVEMEPVVEATSSPGADFLASIHASISDLVSKLDAASTATEKPEVLEFAATFAGTLRAELSAAEGAYSSIYPEAPALASGASEPVDAELIKSWMASNPTRRYALEGIAVRLSKAMSNPNSKEARHSIATAVGSLRLLGSQAKSWKPAEKTSEVSIEQFNRLASAVEKLTEIVAKSPA